MDEIKTEKKSDRVGKTEIKTDRVGKIEKKISQEYSPKNIVEQTQEVFNYRYPDNKQKTKTIQVTKYKNGSIKRRLKGIVKK